VSGVRETPVPEGALCRLAQRPDPLALTPWEFTGKERFDDPRRRFRTMYAATQRLACFLEALAPLRPSPRLIAAWRAMRGTVQSYPSSRIPDDWLRQRSLAHFRVIGEVRLLDARAIETCAVLRTELAETLEVLGLPDLDPSTLRGPQRGLTQAIAMWAFEHGYGGIAYRSRFDDGLAYTLDCWALFEGTATEAYSQYEDMTRADPDLQLAASLHRLEL
jgi:hypothetical protein